MSFSINNSRKNGRVECWKNAALFNIPIFKHSIIPLLAFCLLLSSCSSYLSIEKRKYRDGFHIEQSIFPKTNKSVHKVNPDEDPLIVLHPDSNIINVHAGVLCKDTFRYSTPARYSKITVASYNSSEKGSEREEHGFNNMNPKPSPFQLTKKGLSDRNLFLLIFMLIGIVLLALPSIFSIVALEWGYIGIAILLISFFIAVVGSYSKQKEVSHEKPKGNGAEASVDKKNSPYAIAGLIFGFISVMLTILMFSLPLAFETILYFSPITFYSAIFGFCISLIAIYWINEKKEKYHGKPLAIAGIILSLLSGFIAFFAYFLGTWF